MIIKYLVLAGIIVFYIIYTIRFSRELSQAIYFTKRIRNGHLLMIWLVPFAWIFILKSVMKPTTGSAKIENKDNPESSTESGLGIWMDQNTGTQG